MVDLYVPAGQIVHVPPSCPVYPALHLHAPDPAPGGTEYEFAGQLEHFDEASLLYLPAPHTTQEAVPVCDLKYPAGHEGQGPPFGPVCPAVHTHCVLMLLPLGDVVLTGHARQVDAEFCPVAAERARGQRHDWFSKGSKR